MKAMMMTQFGGPDVFEEREVPIPQPQAQELLVKVYATSVNPMDCQIRQGMAPWTGIQPPAILGYDVSGEVVAVGEGVHDFQVGDQVYYTPSPFSQGSNTEYHAVQEVIVARKPSNLSHLEAAGLPLVGITAWEALVNRAQLKAGETILIHGGAGGVGSLAIQIARAVGATVFTTCSGRNREFVQLLGAEEVIDYTQEDASGVVNQLTQNAGVDVVFDAVGRETLSRSIAATKRFGRLVSIVGPAGDLNASYYKNVAIHFASCQRVRPTLDALRGLIEQGRVKPVVDIVLPLHEVAQAHQRLEQGGVRGKIVLQVQGD
jgi:NADPH:quinone reductase-like Zn-dependent oxidoreductase